MLVVGAIPVAAVPAAVPVAAVLVVAVLDGRDGRDGRGADGPRRHHGDRCRKEELEVARRRPSHRHRAEIGALGQAGQRGKGPERDLEPDRGEGISPEAESPLDRCEVGVSGGKHLVGGEPLHPPAAARAEQPGHARRQQRGAGDARGDRPPGPGRGLLGLGPSRGEEGTGRNGRGCGRASRGALPTAPPCTERDAPSAVTSTGSGTVDAGAPGGDGIGNSAAGTSSSAVASRLVGRGRIFGGEGSLLVGRGRPLISRRGSGARVDDRWSGLGRYPQLPPGEDQVGVVEHAPAEATALVGLPEDRPPRGIAIAAARPVPTGCPRGRP